MLLHCAFKFVPCCLWTFFKHSHRSCLFACVNFENNLTLAAVPYWNMCYAIEGANWFAMQKYVAYKVTANTCTFLNS